MTNPLRRYVDNKSDANWALVTGSTGGIGYEWARQLAGLGFSVLLHGRNPEKLEKVKADILQSLPSTLEGKVNIHPVIADAGASSLGDIASYLDSHPDLNLKVVVNNIGVVHEDYPLLENVSDDEIIKTISTNITFSTLIASKTLPSLKRNQPSLMINTSSLAAYAPGPYLSIYNGTKAYNYQFSRSLHSEMIAENKQVDVIAMLPGTVISGMNQGEPTSFMPLASTWVSSAINSLAPSWLSMSSRPQPVIVPYGPHSRGAKFLNMLPMSLGDKITRNYVKDARDKKQGK
ncbi:unnamed protein product [Sympodiomycopsis kandeliae]